MVNGMKPSKIIQVTGGFFEVAPLSFTRRSENGAKKFFITESQRKWISWVALWSDGGRPSGMVSNRKSDKPSKELGPLDCKKCWWLNSMLTKFTLFNLHSPKQVTFGAGRYILFISLELPKIVEVLEVKLPEAKVEDDILELPKIGSDTMKKLLSS
ncbi:hypothetical protein CFP56_012009 [Quercus suber]|uniref:Uncharacterized protein n=1 Tax=Quercus suber TaxID=58331 RepID=A0AAW0KYQ6_QUESU